MEGVTSDPWQEEDSQRSDWRHLFTPPPLLFITPPPYLFVMNPETIKSRPMHLRLPWASPFVAPGPEPLAQF